MKLTISLLAVLALALSIVTVVLLRAQWERLQVRAGIAQSADEPTEQQQGRCAMRCSCRGFRVSRVDMSMRDCVCREAAPVSLEAFNAFVYGATEVGTDAHQRAGFALTMCSYKPIFEQE